MDSDPNSGTKFKVFLPSAGPRVEAEAKPVDRAPPRGSETVLLFEDEEILQQLIKSALTINGYKVLVAKTAREPWRFASSAGNRST